MALLWTASNQAAATLNCNALFSVGTIFSAEIVGVLAAADAVSTRRLLQNTIAGGTNIILGVDNDAFDPLNMPATEATTARFWSTASLETWDNTLLVEMTFDVPVYTETIEADRYYGSWAQLGSCPIAEKVNGVEDWSHLFTDMTALNAQNTPSICSTFVPLSGDTPTSDALLYARTLAGLVGNGGSSTSCNNTAWPCADRWQIPIVAGFDTQVAGDMIGHRLTNVDQFLPVYPYKYSAQLTQLQECLMHTTVASATTPTWNPIVTTSSVGLGTTDYTFETCIVTYGPRFSYSNNTDLIVHTATQKVVLSSSNEAVVTAVMFDMSDDIRVSMIPDQKSCTQSECIAQTGNLFGPQYPCTDTNTGATPDTVHLELATTIDVPLAPTNTYPVTGIAHISSISYATTAGGIPTGCHLSPSPMDYTMGQWALDKHRHHTVRKSD